jgi:hypothetical protein
LKKILFVYSRQKAVIKLVAVAVKKWRMVENAKGAATRSAAEKYAKANKNFINE